MKLEGQVTIENVAAKAGVSRSTVGRVIGNYGSVSEKSRKKVLEAIEELNYSPNAIAQSLRSKKQIQLLLLWTAWRINFSVR